MCYFSAVLLLLIMNLTTVCISKRKFGNCIPLTMLTIPFVLFASQSFLGTFEVAYYVFYMYGAACIPGVFLRMKKDRKFLSAYYLTMGLWGFLLLSVAVFGLDFTRTFIEDDEFSHWGYMVKEMVRLDKWYFVTESNVPVHKEYPPFMSLFELFWCHFAGRYHESALYHGIHSFMFTLLICPIAEQIRWGKKSMAAALWKLLLICASFLLIVKCFDTAGILETVYTDIVLAVIFTYGMIIIWHAGEITHPLSFVCLITSTAALVLTKQMGITFALILWIFYGMTMLARVDHSKINKLREALKFAGLVIVPLTLRKIWGCMAAAAGVSDQQFDLSEISIAALKDILSDNLAETIRRQTLNSYVHALADRSIVNMNVTITFISMLIIVTILFAFIYKFTDENFNKKDFIVIEITLVCGTLGYAFTMCILYLFCYSDFEMSILASYGRYMSGYAMAEFLIIFVIIIELIENGEKKLQYLLAGIESGLVLAGAPALSAFVPAIFQPDSNKELQWTAEYIGEHTDKDDVTFALTDNPIGVGYKLGYYGNDIFTVSTGGEYFLNLDYSYPQTVEYVKDNVFGYDYLYVIDVTEEFNEAFNSINNGEDFESGTMYKVTNDENEIRTEKVMD